MAKKKGEKPNLDDFLDELRSKNVSSLDDAFGHWYDHIDDDKQKELLTDFFGKAMDEFYDSFTERLEKEVGEGKTKLEGKEDGVKKALLSGMKAYLKKVMPSALAMIKGVEDEIEQYKILSHHMDEYLPLITNEKGEPIKLDNFVKNIMKDKKKKANDLKTHFYASKTQTAMVHRESLNQQYKQSLFGSYRQHEVVAYIKPDVEKKYSIEDAVKFTTISTDEALHLHHHIKKGKKLEKDAGQYGLEVRGEE